MAQHSYLDPSLSRSQWAAARADAAAASTSSLARPAATASLAPAAISSSSGRFPGVRSVLWARPADLSSHSVSLGWRQSMPFIVLAPAALRALVALGEADAARALLSRATLQLVADQLPPAEPGEPFGLFFSPQPGPASAPAPLAAVVLLARGSVRGGAASAADGPCVAPRVAAHPFNALAEFEALRVSAAASTHFDDDPASTCAVNLRAGSGGGERGLGGALSTLHVVLHIAAPACTLRFRHLWPPPLLAASPLVEALLAPTGLRGIASPVPGAQCGPLTLDAARHAVPLLPSDPACRSTPLVGMWVRAPFVPAAALPGPCVAAGAPAFSALHGAFGVAPFRASEAAPAWAEAALRHSAVRAALTWYAASRDLGERAHMPDAPRTVLVVLLPPLREAEAAWRNHGHEFERLQLQAELDAAARGPVFFECDVSWQRDEAGGGWAALDVLLRVRLRTLGTGAETVACASDVGHAAILADGSVRWDLLAPAGLGATALQADHAEAALSAHARPPPPPPPPPQSPQAPRTSNDSLIPAPKWQHLASPRAHTRRAEQAVAFAASVTSARHMADLIGAGGLGSFASAQQRRNELQQVPVVPAPSLQTRAGVGGASATELRSVGLGPGHAAASAVAGASPLRIDSARHAGAGKEAALAALRRAAAEADLFAASPAPQAPQTRQQAAATLSSEAAAESLPEDGFVFSSAAHRELRDLAQGLENLTASLAASFAGSEEERLRRRELSEPALAQGRSSSTTRPAAEASSYSAEAGHMSTARIARRLAAEANEAALGGGTEAFGGMGSAAAQDVFERVRLRQGGSGGNGSGGRGARGAPESTSVAAASRSAYFALGLPQAPQPSPRSMPSPRSTHSLQAQPQPQQLPQTPPTPANYFELQRAVEQESPPPPPKQPPAPAPAPAPVPAPAPLPNVAPHAPGDFAALAILAASAAAAGGRAGDYSAAAGRFLQRMQALPSVPVLAARARSSLPPPLMPLPPLPAIDEPSQWLSGVRAIAETISTAPAPSEAACLEGVAEPPVLAPAPAPSEAAAPAPTEAATPAPSEAAMPAPSDTASRRGSLVRQNGFRDARRASTEAAVAAAATAAAAAATAAAAAAGAAAAAAAAADAAGIAASAADAADAAGAAASAAAAADA